MSGGSRIIAFGGAEGDGTATGHGPEADGNQTSATEVEEEPSSDFDDDAESTVRRSSSGTWLPIVLGLAAIAGWTVFYIWANRSAFAAGTAPSQWTQLIAGWTPPVLLICVLWLIAMRSSSREATRFGNAAHLLSTESARLESRLLTVNRELSLAREFLSAQSRDLEALGRLATERLSKNADRLQELVGENSVRVETIGQVSEVALVNMEKLRGQLPVISSSAKDVTNNIGNAGRTAQTQIEEMVRGFHRINDFGDACQAQVASLRNSVEETLSGLAEQCEQLEKIAAGRFAELTDRSAEFRTQLDHHEIDALASVRQRASALSEELDAVRANFRDSESHALQSLDARIAGLRDQGEAVSRLLHQSEQQAAENWRNAMAVLEQDRDALFARMEQADAASAQRAQQRVASIQAEAELIEAGMVQRADRLLSELAERRDQAEAAERQVLGRFSDMLESLDREIAQRSDAQRRHAEEMALHAAQIAEQFGASQSDLSSIAASAAASGMQVRDSLADISTRLSEAKSHISQTEGQLFGLTDSSVRLLELVHATSQEVGTALPAAFQKSEATLDASQSRALAISDSLRQAGKDGQQIADQIERSQSELKTLLSHIEVTQSRLRDEAASHRETLKDLCDSLAQLADSSDSISQQARTELAETLATMESSARETVSLISEKGAQGISRIVSELQETSADVIGRAIHNSMASVSGQLEQAAAHAAGVSREATIQLRDQLGKVNELVANLENRVSRARERAEEQVDNDFARRAALITESLNSNAIDIAKALSSDVADTAWEGYLRGDRGIFTRRAVSLIDGGDARQIQQVFERDSDFRTHVSRYIHDFEGMLRQVLSTRDGTALGVTLLSSDMGKLYVALAQAIERLRT